MVVRDRACSTTSFLRGASAAQLRGWGRGETGAETAPGCAMEAQAQGRKQDGGRGLWERKRGFPGGGGAEAGERGRGGGGKQPDGPLPAPSEAVRVGQLGVGAGAQLASSGNQRAGEGHRTRQWDCVSVGEYVCTLRGGGRREEGEGKGGGGSSSSRRSICEGRSRPRLWGTENKGPAEISASERLRRAERGRGEHDR